MTAPLRHPLVVLKERPFDGRVRILPVGRAGQTIEQIFAAQTDLPPKFAERCVARINDQVIPREMWSRVRLKADPGRDVVVTFALPVRSGGGGGGGHKNTFATIAMIAVMLVAAAVTGGAAAPLLGSSFAAGTVGASVLGAAIGIGGALAISALVPPPSLSTNQGAPPDQGVNKPAASLSGNILSKGNPIPRVVGTMRVFPPIISPPLTELVGDDWQAEAIYGLSGPHLLSDLMVGNTTAASIPDLQIELQEGLPNSPQAALVTRQSYTDPGINFELTKHAVDNSTGGGGINLLNQSNPPLSCPQWHGMTTRASPDEAWLTISLPTGCVDSSGHAMLIPFRVRMRQVGAANWINLPELQAVNYSLKQINFMIKMLWQAPPATRNVMPDQGGPVYAYSYVPPQVHAPAGIGGWESDAYFYSSGAGSTVSGATGTAIGTLTGGGNLAAAFNGTNTQLLANCASLAGTGSITATVGKQWNDLTSLLKVDVYASSDAAFTNSANKNITLSVQGSNDGSSWTTLATDGPFTSSNSQHRTISIPQTVGESYAYHRVVLVESAGDVSSHTVCISQVVFSSANDAYLYSGNVSSTTGIQNVDLFADKAVFYLNDNVKFPKGSWEIQVMRGQSVRAGDFSLRDYTTANVIYDLFGYITSPAQTLYNQNNIQDTAQIVRFSSIWNEHPVPYPDKFATVALKVTNRAIDQVSILASGYVNDWDGTGWNTLTTTSNPAPHLWDVLTGTQGGLPLPVDIVDSASLVAFRSHCAAQGYTCDAVVEGKTYIDVATMVAASGYARLSHNEKWGVILDRDRSGDSPVQIFTPRNMNGFSFTRAFARPSTGIRAGFINSANNYQSDETIVYADPANPDSSRLDQIQYDGLVDEADVRARAAFDLLQSKVRMTFYKGKADLESIVCQRGDLVGVQYDIIDRYAGFSRIQSISRSGGNITGLTLDGTVPVTTGTDIKDSADLSVAGDIADFGAVTGIAIRMKGGNGIITKQITSTSDGETTAITFATPFADPGASQIDVGCLCTLGRIGSEYKRLIVYSITPNVDMTADMIFVDEAPELFS